MSTLWLRIRNLMKRDPTARDGAGRSRAGGGRQGAPDPAATTSAHSWGWPLLCGFILLFLHLIFFPPVPRIATDFPQVGEIAAREIRAPFTFKGGLLDQDINMRQFQTIVKTPPVFDQLEPRRGGEQARMEVLLQALAAGLADTTATLEERATMLSLQFSALGRDEARRLLMSAPGDSLVIKMREAWLRVLDGGVVDMLPEGQYEQVTLARAGTEESRPLTAVVAQDDLQRRLTQTLRGTGLPTDQSVTVASLMRHFISPNLVFSPEKTRLKQEEARDAVTTTREFFKGERIVDRGVRVTPQQGRYLDDLEKAIAARGGGEETLQQSLRYISRALLVALALGLFGWFGVIHFPAEFRRMRTLVALTILMGLFLLGAAVALGSPALGPFAVPVVLLSLVTTVLFRDKVGYNITLVAVTLLAILTEFHAGQVFAWYLLGMVTVVMVRRIRKRGQFYQTIMVLALLSLAMIFLLDMVGMEGPRSSYLVGGFAPILLVAFGLFLLPVIEPLVGVCSDLTLLELSDLNHPLLQRMALEAQGTYHHSQVVGQLAEHAARAIDANSLLTRVGALYHDIGKMEKSEYYVENQHPDHNKHDELSPSMSALIIAAHVKEGIELARKWRLPQAVIDFIPEHHGTMVMEYFYHKALSSESNAPVKVDDFRYPGPKPRCRETAILMLADAVEAATRSLGKPTPSRIREITKQIIDKRMLSGELDESGLTLSDLARSREAFIPLLTGIHHARIVYPGQKEKEADKVPEKRGERKVKP